MVTLDPTGCRGNQFSGRFVRTVEIEKRIAIALQSLAIYDIAIREFGRVTRTVITPMLLDLAFDDGGFGQDSHDLAPSHSITGAKKAIHRKTDPIRKKTMPKAPTATLPQPEPFDSEIALAFMVLPAQ